MSWQQMTGTIMATLTCDSCGRRGIPWLRCAEEAARRWHATAQGWSVGGRDLCRACAAWNEQLLAMAFAGVAT